MSTIPDSTQPRQISAPPSPPPSVLEASITSPSPSPSPSPSLQHSVHPGTAHQPLQNTESGTPLRTSYSSPSRETSDSVQPAYIPRPTWSERQQPGFFFNILGIGKRRIDRRPLQLEVSNVWNARPELATTESTWTELPTEDRLAAEQELQTRLEQLYPLPSDIGNRVRECREWLPGLLLAQRHTQKKARQVNK